MIGVVVGLALLTLLILLFSGLATPQQASNTPAGFSDSIINQINKVKDSQEELIYLVEVQKVEDETVAREVLHKAILDTENALKLVSDIALVDDTGGKFRSKATQLLNNTYLYLVNYYRPYTEKLYGEVPTEAWYADFEEQTSQYSQRHEVILAELRVAQAEFAELHGLTLTQ
jgi:hypothetical protein